MSSSAPAATLQANVWAKIFVHCAQHVDAPVFGVLLAGEDGNITDAVPLFHSNPMAPMTELAMSMVEKHAAACGSTVAGVYCANRHATDVRPSTVISAIAAKIAAKYPAAILCMLNASSLTTAPTKAIGVFKHNDGSWRAVGTATLQDMSKELLVKTIRSGLGSLADFDDHLEDVSKDWTNPTFASRG